MEENIVKISMIIFKYFFYKLNVKLCVMSG